jgi:hypothetical protein
LALASPGIGNRYTRDNNISLCPYFNPDMRIVGRTGCMPPEPRAGK